MRQGRFHDSFDGQLNQRGIVAEDAPTTSQLTPEVRLEALFNLCPLWPPRFLSYPATRLPIAPRHTIAQRGSTKHQLPGSSFSAMLTASRRALRSVLDACLSHWGLLDWLRLIWCTTVFWYELASFAWSLRSCSWPDALLSPVRRSAPLSAFASRALICMQSPSHFEESRTAGSRSTSRGPSSAGPVNVQGCGFCRGSPASYRARIEAELVLCVAEEP